jgi:hypothetical protein
MIVLGATPVALLAMLLWADCVRAQNVTVQTEQPPSVVVQPPAQPAPSVVVQPPQPSVVVQPSQPSVVVQPAQPSVIVQSTPLPPQTLQAGDIEAQQVRAHAIYANKIKAAHVQGAIHQTGGVKVKGHGDIKAPMVSASVIYAEDIKADSVVADNIYVRELKRK